MASLWRLRGRGGWWLAAAALLVVAGLVAFNVVLAPSLDALDKGAQLPDKCRWTPADPVLYNIHTSLGVNYDAGHWFHMAENIMTYHSALRSKGQLANASQVFFNFDQKEFPTNLNGMTRFITYLGIVAPRVQVDSLRFMHDERFWHAVQVGDTFLSDPSSHGHGLQDQRMSLAPGVASAQRFVELSPHASTAAGRVRGMCVKFGGTVGGKWPTVQRGHWFPNAGDVESFREKIRTACPAPAAPKMAKFKLVLYQRDLSRRLLNQQEALAMLGETLSADWQVQVLMHSGKRSPCELFEIIHDADLLLTPHGFQSMLLILMAPQKLLFEVFPYRYYKPAYSPFGHEFGVHHGGVMSVGTNWLSEYVLKYVTTPTCMFTKQCRVRSRDQDVILSRHGVNRLARMVEKVFGKAALRSGGSDRNRTLEL